MIALLLIPAAVSAAAATLGALRTRPGTWGGTLALAIAAALAAAALAASAHDPDVSTADFAKGVALGVVAGGLAPIVAYWLLGRALHRHRVVLAVVWLVTLVPLGYYLLLCWLATAALTACPPGAYECPV